MGGEVCQALVSELVVEERLNLRGATPDLRDLEESMPQPDRQRQPITVWKRGDVLVVVDGHRRLAVAKARAWKTIMVMFRDYASLEDATLDAFIINMERDALPKAAQYAWILNSRTAYEAAYGPDHGGTHAHPSWLATMAAKTGKSQKHWQRQHRKAVLFFSPDKTAPNRTDVSTCEGNRTPKRTEVSAWPPPPPELLLVWAFWKRLWKRIRRILAALLVGSPAKFVDRAANAKLSPVDPDRHVPVGPLAVAATYLSFATCPKDCPLWAICYAKTTYLQGLVTGRLDLAARRFTGCGIVGKECRVIRDAIERGIAADGRPLRLHISGDVHCEHCTRFLAQAAAEWLAAGGGPVWTYTHRWSEVPRDAFGPIVAWASIESPGQIAAAEARGYRTVLVVTEFPDGQKAFQAAGRWMLPCPYEAATERKPTCVECRACFTDERKIGGIAFRLHGQAAQRLVTLGVGGQASAP